MSQFLDGVSSSATQNGPKQISLPLKADGNYYATKVSRNYIASPADSYSPILGQRTAYTSLLKYSDDFSQANWVKVNTTGAVTSAVYDPEGGVTASKVAEDATGGAIAHNVSQVLACAAGATPFGVFARAAERSFIRLRLYNATDGSLGNAVFNLGTGVLVSGTGEIKKLLYGWYWCYITPTAAVTNSTLFVDIGSDATTWSYAGTAGSGVYLWRATAYLAATIGPAIATTSTTPTAVTAPPIDADDPTAFLVDEQECDAGALEIGVARWNRQYANVPAQTITPDSISFTRPIIYNSYMGSANLTLSDYTATPIVTTTAGTSYEKGTIAAYTSELLYEAIGHRLFAPVKSSSAGAAAYPISAGTFTVQFGANTTAAIAYNDSNANIATAINALASVIAAGITVTVVNSLAAGGQLSITLTVGTTLSPFIVNGAGLTTNNGRTESYTIITTATVQAVVFSIKVNCPLHGLTNTGQSLAALSTVVYVLPSTLWSVFDANTLLMPSNVGVAAIKIAGYKQQYTPGIDDFPARIVRDFYLPGITPGIASATDIVIPDSLTNDSVLFSALATSAGWTCYSVKGPLPWLGPILKMEQAQINLNAL